MSATPRRAKAGEPVPLEDSECADGPADRTLAAWADLSARTLSRLYLAETGCSFAQWLQQARLTHALERLAEGDAVAQVADALGYATPSNFIAMFRSCFGDSPAHYFTQRGVPVA